MRGGVQEQNTILTEMRKQCRVNAGMSRVKGFSRLTADLNKVKLGKRGRHSNSDARSADDARPRKRARNE